jgi:hypothetical protein
MGWGIDRSENDSAVVKVMVKNFSWSFDIFHSMNIFS